MSWEDVDTGWGRRAAAFAYLIENVHWREYLHLLEQTGVGPGISLPRHCLWRWSGRTAGV